MSSNNEPYGTEDMKNTTIGGVQFRCVRPGSWVSIDGAYTLAHMLAGTAQQQWELYHSENGNDFAELIDTALSMSEIVEMFKGKSLPERSEARA